MIRVDLLFAVHLHRNLEACVDEFWMDGASVCQLLVLEVNSALG